MDIHSNVINRLDHTNTVVEPKWLGKVRFLRLDDGNGWVDKWSVLLAVLATTIATVILVFCVVSLMYLHQFDDGLIIEVNSEPLPLFIDVTYQTDQYIEP